VTEQRSSATATPATVTPATVFLRPIGSPVALGLAGLVGASLVVSGLELGWVGAGERTAVALAMLAFAFPLQFAASMLAFQARDAAVGTAMGILAATWLCTGLTFLSSAPRSTSGALGLLLLASGALLVMTAIATATGKLAPALVFVVEGIRFGASAIHELGGGGFWQDAAGILGLVVVALAGYTMTAAVLEDARDRTVLPLGRRGRGRSALTATFDEQIHSVEHEAGVRKQL
jgi:succinate-acetate transporter protein